MRQNAVVCTNAQALWREPQTNRTVRTERRKTKPQKIKKRPLPQSPLPLSGKGRGEAQKHASVGEEFGQRQERGQRRMGKEDRAAAFKGGVGAEGEGKTVAFRPVADGGRKPCQISRFPDAKRSALSTQKTPRNVACFAQKRPRFSPQSGHYLSKLLVFFPRLFATLICPRFDLAERREMPNFAKHSFALDTGRTLKPAAL